MYRLAVLVALFAACLADPAISADGSLIATCTDDSNCKSLDWGLRKIESGIEVPDARDGQCCKSSKASSGLCYLSSWYTCTSQGTDYADTIEKIACKKKDWACGSQCCDRTEQRCETYTDSNGFTRSQCVKKFNRRINFWIVGLPLVLFIFLLAGLGAAVVTVGRDLKFMGLPAKLAAVFSLILSLFALLFIWSSAWQYAVTMLLTAMVGIAGLKTGNRSVTIVVIIIHWFLFVALLGWGQNNILWGSWAEGILSDSALMCSAKWEDWFGRTSLNSGKWIDATRALAANKDYHRIGKAWGYCDEEWLVALRVFAAMEICLSVLMLMAQIANAVYVYPDTDIRINKLTPVPQPAQ